MTPTRTVLMTGASRGLGHHAALHVLRTRPDVHLIVTNRDADGGALARSLSGRSGSGNVSELTADLASLGNVRDLAQNVIGLTEGGSVPPLQAVLANAGVQRMSTTRATTDGHELTFGVNVLANVVLIEELAGHMTLPGRIVITSSDTHFGDFRHNMGLVPGPTWRPAEELASPGSGRGAGSAKAGATAYSTSKLAVIHYVHALAKLLPRGLDVYSYNPGLVPGTGLARDRNIVNRVAWKAVMPMMTATPLATGPKRAGRLLAEAAVGGRPAESGAYLDRGRPADSSPESYDREREDALWHSLKAVSQRPAESN
jgi:NAD(P)-dependent dehydrogenase (short-subunit alcohol dehydrogenase family)